MAFEWLFPPPLRNRGGLACKFPTMIYLPAHGSRKLQKVLDLRNVSFDADVPGVRLQILCERQIGSVLHRQGHTAFLRSYDVVSNSPQSDTHGANDQAGSLFPRHSGTFPASSSAILQQKIARRAMFRFQRSTDR